MGPNTISGAMKARIEAERDNVETGKAALRQRVEEERARADKAEAELAAVKAELDGLREACRHAQATVKYDESSRLITIIAKIGGETRYGEPIPLAKFCGAIGLPVHILED